MGEWLLDIRSKESFAQGHIPGSMNIPLGPSFVAWSEKLVPQDIGLTIIHDDIFSPDKVKPYLTQRSNKILYLHIKERPERATLHTLSVEELASDPSYYIVDVRSLEEWEMGHIPTAHLLPLQEKNTHLPQDKKIAVICGSGYRSAIFASFLQKEGYTQVANVLGGMRAWIEHELPITS